MPDSPARTCPKCATAIPASFPEGLCPKCLLEQAAPDAPAAGVTQLPTLADLDASEKTIPVAPPVSGSTPVRLTGVPSLETLRGLFPELEILGVLGAGGMGAVFKARQPRLNRLVALKIMVAAPGHETDFALRFEREAQVLARLNHPHIVILYDFGELGPERTGADPLFYFLMEYVDGTDLGQLIKSKELKPTQALAIVPQICEALQYAHDQGITHRDIKPANILIDKRGVVKIADFGLAKMITGTEEALMTGLTQTGTAMGTPHYMAPEQWEHPEQVDHRADIYALGVVFYEMLTGERPAGVFEPPSKKSKSPVDKKLDGVVMRAMDKNPDRRYQQAGQIGDDVTRISGANKRKPATTHGVPETKRGPLKPLLAVGVVASLAFGGWKLWQGRAAGPPAAVPPKTALPGPSAPPATTLPKHEWVKVDWPGQKILPGGKSSRQVTQEEITKDGGLRLVQDDLWIGSQMPRIGKMQNGGIRLRWKRLSEKGSFNVFMRGTGKVKVSLWGNAATIFHGAANDEFKLGGLPHGGFSPLGQEVLMEIACVGRLLILKRDGVLYGTQELPETAPADYLRFQGSEVIVTQAELISLDHLSEADALKVLGVDNAVPSIAATGKAAGPPAAEPSSKALGGPSALPSAKPGRLRATGTMLNGKLPELAKTAAHDDFVDVAGGMDSWVALRANGETVSSDGQADFQGIRKIARSYQSYACFIDMAGGLRFHPAREVALPASLKGAKVADAACGSHHGVALLEDGRAVAFGRRYEEAVEDVSQAQGSGTPRWPQPEAAALQNVKGVAVTQTHAATLHHDGTVSVWGWEGPVKWQPEPEMKPVRQISSFHDTLHLLDEAGQVWSFPLPRSSHPEQPVGFNGRVKLLGKDAVRLRDHLWLDADGAWRAVEADRPTVEMLASVKLSPETNFALLASISGAKPYGYVLWIEPEMDDEGAARPAESVKGRLRASGITANGKPHDLTKFAAHDDFVDVAGGWGRWVALRANGQAISSDGRADFTGIAKITASFNAEYAFITTKGKLVIPDYEKWTLPSSLEQGVVDAALGMQHGIALLEGGRAVVFGARYEGGVGDPADPKQYGTPRWPAPEAAALEKVQAVAATVTHAATLHEDGSLSLWGWEGPLKWQADPRQQKLRQLRSTEDEFWALDEAGQLWHLPVPRNPAPGQPVRITGKPFPSELGITHLRSRCWRRKNGVWIAHMNTKNGNALMKEAGLTESTAFSLSGGMFDGKPFASLLWIEPLAPGRAAGPPAAGVPPQTALGAPSALPPFTDREAAEWALKWMDGINTTPGGVMTGVRVRVSNLPEKHIMTSGELPQEPFTVTAIHCLPPDEQREDAAILSRITDADVIRLAALNNLRELHLHGTLTGRSLAAIMQLPALEVLTLSSARFETGDLAALKGGKLRELGLLDFRLREPASLEVLRTLPALRLLRFNLGADPELVAALPSLPQLQKLGITNSPKLTDEALPLIVERFPALELVNLARCGKIQGTHLGALKHLSKLALIELTDTAVDDAALAVLQGMNLPRLILRSTRVTDASVPLLINLPLAELEIGNTRITDAGLARLAESKTLKRLYLHTYRGAGFTDAGIAAFQKLRPDVEVVK